MSDPVIVHFSGVTPPRPEWADCPECVDYYVENAGAIMHAAASAGIERGLTTNAAIDAYFTERHTGHTGGSAASEEVAS